MLKDVNYQIFKNKKGLKYFYRHFNPFDENFIN